MIKICLQKKLNTASGSMLLDIDLAFNSGELITLYGESGAGKTTTLKMIAGLTKADNGNITVNDKVWLDTSKNISLKPQERDIALVFQDYALFPNMTVRENLKFALKKQQPDNFIDSIIETIELTALQNKKPKELSGGQQQRVALARALVQQPKFLLLDEPLSALDSDMRSKLQNLILKMHKKFQCTTILISHDIGEIFKLSTKVFVIKDGAIIQSGAPETVFATETVDQSFQFKGEVLSIKKEDTSYSISVLVGQRLLKLNVLEEEAHSLTIGDSITIAPEKFKPVIKKAKN